MKNRKIEELNNYNNNNNKKKLIFSKIDSLLNMNGLMIL